MKDYYYTLGINRKAALSDIQQAYRKLSLKFHPKENGEDPFFALHYEKIKEAYQVLSDDHKRFRYDKAFEKQLSVEVGDKVEAPLPIIAAFFASKNAVQCGDVITISWEVLNAETVRINLIGEVSTNGTQTIRLTVPSPSEPYLYLDLEASNNSVQSSRKRLALKNSAFKAGLPADIPPPVLVEDTYWEASIPVTKEDKSSTPEPIKNKIAKKATKKTKPRTPKKQSTNSPNKGSANAWIAYTLIIALFFMIAVMLYTLFLINPVF